VQASGSSDKWSMTSARRGWNSSAAVIDKTIGWPVGRLASAHLLLS